MKTSIAEFKKNATELEAHRYDKKTLACVIIYWDEHNSMLEIWKDLETMKETMIIYCN